MRKLTSVFFALLIAFLASCENDSSGLLKRAGVTTKGGNLFAQGCPVPGKSVAKQITNPKLRMDGPDALGGVGDYLLMNERAAFIIQGTDHPINTYLYYAGSLIDAVAIEGCSQAGPERFEEVGIIISDLAVDLSWTLPQILAAVSGAGIRLFRGDNVQIINDGSDGGDARIRVTGADDFFWLIELELIGIIFNLAAVEKPLSDPVGLEVYVDYVLPPGSGALRIEINLKNPEAAGGDVPILTGSVLFFGDTTDVKFPYQDVETTLESLLGKVPIGVPWIVASGGDGAWSFSMMDSFMGTANVSETDAALDTNLLLNAQMLQPGESAAFTFFFGVGGKGHNSGVVPIIEAMERQLTRLREKACRASTSKFK